MAESPGSNVRRRHIGKALQRLREDAGKTQKAAGHLLERSPSSISLIENGLQPLRCRDLKHILDMYGVTDQALRAGLIELARQDHQTGWWQDFADVASQENMDHASLEHDATTLDAVETHFIPGLMQTEEYARAIMRASLSETLLDKADRWVAYRMARQRVLHRPTPPRLRLIMDEATLRRLRGGPRVMQAQLQRVLDESELNNITIQVLPLACSTDPGVNETFWILELGQPTILQTVLVSHLTGRWPTEDGDRLRYREAFDRAGTAALSETDSRDLIRRIMSEL